jgi:hypothetical protein
MGGDDVKQSCKLLVLVKAAIKDNETSLFLYSLEEKICIVSEKTIIGNLTPDYTPLF